MNLKYGQLFANQSESSKTKAETENGTSEEQNETIDNQSHLNRTFEKDYGVNKIQQSENITSGQSAKLKLPTERKLKICSKQN